MRRLPYAIAVLLVGAGPLAGCIPAGGGPPHAACIDLLQPAGATTPAPVVLGVHPTPIPGCLNVSDQLDQFQVVAPPGAGIKIRCLGPEHLLVGVQTSAGLSQIQCDATGSGNLQEEARGLVNTFGVQVATFPPDPIDPPAPLTEDTPYLVKISLVLPGQ